MNARILVVDDTAPNRSSPATRTRLTPSDAASRRFTAQVGEADLEPRLSVP